MCSIRWSPPSSVAARASWKTVSEGEWPGRCRTRSVRSRELQHLAVGQPARDRRAAAPGAERARDRAQRGRPRRAGSRGAASAPRRTRRRAPPRRRSPRAAARAGRARTTSAPERRARMSTSPMWSMCWWVTTIRSRSSIRWPCSRERALELVERLAGVRARVDERQRVVLDQVAVDAPDRERRRDRDAVDRAAHERISAAPRRAGAPCPRWRRASRGSGAAAARCSTARTLKCQSS